MAQVLILTGATGRIGQALARQLAGPDRVLVAVGRDEQALARLTASLTPGARVHPVVCDVTREDQVDELFRQAGTQGAVRTWVHAAGLEVGGSIAGGDVEAWRRMLEVNVLSAAIMARGFLAHWDGRDAILVWIGSRRSKGPSPGDAVYAATKAALASLAVSLRAETKGTRLRLTLLEPAVVAAGRRAALEPAVVAATVKWLVDLPRSVEIPLLRLRHRLDHQPRPPRG